MTVAAFVAAPILALALAPETAEADPAKVLDVKLCTILDGNGNFYRTTEKNKAVYNDGGDILKCSAKGIPATDKAVHFDKASTGYVCSTGQHTTDDWKLTVSASGNATLTCHFKKTGTQ